jgi:beta-1,2-mannobiose phosphorylase / 1,2-beta-oligomannan phosphorylase
MMGKQGIPPVPNIKLVLERFGSNPILTPDARHAWETKGVFNPAALYENGKVHLLYRALGDTDVSVLGYASSNDGYHIQERLPYPVYVPREPFEGVSPAPVTRPGTPGVYTSGGGEMGGCEDPRLTRIGDTVYITYVAYDGRTQPRVALSSISYKKFLNRNWNWKKPVLISPPHIVDKNACLLPEKIDGKYVIFHRVFPNILIDFVDDLDFDGKTRWLTGQYEIPARVLSSDWDSRKVGCGPPPLRTKDGWLLIYHAVGATGDYRYKVGAMLLDIKDPTRVLARSKNPILEPDAWYENNGFKAGVVYPCGAAIIDQRLFVYYGGADTVVCVASVKLNGFLETLVTENKEITVRKTIAEEVPEATKEPLQAQGYCLKCRKIKTIHNPRRVTMKNMKEMIKGVCPGCGAKISAFVPAVRRKKKPAVKKAKGSTL